MTASPQSCHAGTHKVVSVNETGQIEQTVGNATVWNWKFDLGNCNRCPQASAHATYEQGMRFAHDCCVHARARSVTGKPGTEGKTHLKSAWPERTDPGWAVLPRLNACHVQRANAAPTAEWLSHSTVRPHQNMP